MERFQYHVRLLADPNRPPERGEVFGRGDDTVGSPHRAQIYTFELFEFILLSNVDKQFSIEQVEPTAVSSPPLSGLKHNNIITINYHIKITLNKINNKHNNKGTRNNLSGLRHRVLPPRALGGPRRGRPVLPPRPPAAPGAYIYIYIYIYCCMYVYIYIYIYIYI